MNGSARVIAGKEILRFFRLISTEESYQIAGCREIATLRRQRSLTVCAYIAATNGKETIRRLVQRTAWSPVCSLQTATRVLKRLHHDVKRWTAFWPHFASMLHLSRQSIRITPPIFEPRRYRPPDPARSSLMSPVMQEVQTPLLQFLLPLPNPITMLVTPSRLIKDGLL